MPQRQFNHLPYLSHLLSAATNVIIANFIQFFFIFSFDWLPFGVENSLRSDDADFPGLGCDYFELYGFEIASYDEVVSFFNWAIGVLEVGDEVGLGQIAADSFDGVVKGQYVDFGQVWNLLQGLDLNDVAEPDSEVFSDHFIHSHFFVIQSVIDNWDGNSFLTLFTFD